MYEACLEFPEGEVWLICGTTHCCCVVACKLSAALKEYRIVLITYVLAENLNLHPSSSLQASFLHDYFWLKILRYYSLKSWNGQDTNLMLFDLETYGKYIYFVLLTAEAFFKVKKKIKSKRTI